MRFAMKRGIESKIKNTITTTIKITITI